MQPWSLGKNSPEYFFGGGIHGTVPDTWASCLPHSRARVSFPSFQPSLLLLLKGASASKYTLGWVSLSKEYIFAPCFCFYQRSFLYFALPPSSFDYYYYYYYYDWPFVVAQITTPTFTSQPGIAYRDNLLICSRTSRHSSYEYIGRATSICEHLHRPMWDATFFFY